MKNLKSQKGITMISLLFYVVCFLAVTVTIGIITTFFYSNMQIMSTRTGSNSDYNKLNLYLLNECKKPGVSLFAWRCYKETGITGDFKRLTNLPTGDTNSFITFASETGNKNTFVYDKDTKSVYYNEIKLCEFVDDFQIKLDQSTGKDVLTILINIDGTAFQTKYVVGA